MRHHYHKIVGGAWLAMIIMIAFTWISDSVAARFVDCFVLPIFYFGVPALSVFLEEDRRWLAFISVSMSFILPATCIFVYSVFSNGIPNTGYEWLVTWRASANAGLIGVLLVYAVPALQYRSEKYNDPFRSR